MLFSRAMFFFLVGSVATVHGLPMGGPSDSSQPSHNVTPQEKGGQDKPNPPSFEHYHGYQTFPEPKIGTDHKSTDGKPSPNFVHYPGYKTFPVPDTDKPK
ncbi:hypothetical protein F5887DRAFT_236170 [Amanita rubescens]|nr:hypothetical protein F5887DRAFT_236170 [Amanita rubescens]